MKLSREKIDLFMAKKAWDAPDLANAYGATRQRINNILNARQVRPKTAGKLAQALGVDVTEILED